MAPNLTSTSYYGTHGSLHPSAFTWAFAFPFAEAFGAALALAFGTSNQWLFTEVLCGNEVEIRMTC